jgi:hypothetical protein
MHEPTVIRDGGANVEFYWGTYKKERAATYVHAIKCLVLMPDPNSS